MIRRQPASRKITNIKRKYEFPQTLKIYRKTHKNEEKENAKESAARKIQRFMKNPKVIAKRSALFLNNICSDSNICIAFGVEQPKIHKFFDGYVNKRYMQVPIKRMGAPSANGVVSRIEYNKNGYISHAALKTTTNKMADNLVYEYMVGKYLTKMSKYYPCLVQTYSMIKYTDDASYEKIRNGSVVSQADLDAFRFEPIQVDGAPDDILREACNYPQKYAVLVQDIKDAKTFYEIHAQGNLSASFLLLHQIYFTLNCMRSTFTHYDLHLNNVLCYSVGNKKYIEFVYHNNDGTTLKYNCDKLAYMIDYGRCFFHESNIHNSISVLNKICSKEVGCPSYCGTDEGFANLYGNPYINIYSHKRNISADLRLLKMAFAERYLGRKSSVYDSIVFDGTYSTPEIVQEGFEYGRIQNVMDALKMINGYMETSNREMTAFYVSEGFEKLGTLHIYEDGATPMKYVPHAESIAMEVSPLKKDVEELETKIRTLIKQMENLPNMHDKLKYYREKLYTKDRENTLINRIDKELYKYDRALCGELYQLHIPDDKMKGMISSKTWSPLMDEEDPISCGLNVLSFLGFLPKKYAASKRTCVNMDTGFTMNDIKDVITKNNKVEHLFQVNKMDFSISILKTFIFEQLQNESATIVRLYKGNRSVEFGRTLILYRYGIHLYVIDPQMQIFGEMISKSSNKLEFREDLDTKTSKHRELLDLLNASSHIEFFVVNENMVVRKSNQDRKPAFEPRVISYDTPFHMFLLVAHGASVREDRKTESISFPFNSLGFFVEKNQRLDLDTMDMDRILGEIGDSIRTQFPEMENSNTKVGTTKRRLADIVMNTTGKIDVYPMYWYASPSDNEGLRNVMGMYHLFYNKEKGALEIVNKISGYEIFVNKNTGRFRKLYYGDVIRSFYKYYDENRNTTFKTIPKELIFMGMFGARSVDNAILRGSPESSISGISSKSGRNTGGDRGNIGIGSNVSRYREQNTIDIVGQREFFEYALREKRTASNKTRKRKSPSKRKTLYQHGPTHPRLYK